MVVETASDGDPFVLEVGDGIGAHGALLDAGRDSLGRDPGARELLPLVVERLRPGHRQSGGAIGARSVSGVCKQRARTRLSVGCEGGAVWERERVMYRWLTTWSNVAAQASRRVRNSGRLKSFFNVAGRDECS
jgi:hypothetical protein